MVKKNAAKLKKSNTKKVASSKTAVKKPAKPKTAAKKTVRAKTAAKKTVRAKTAVKKPAKPKTAAKKSVTAKNTVKKSTGPTEKTVNKKGISVSTAKTLNRKKVIKSNKLPSSAKITSKSKVGQKLKVTKAQKKTAAVKSDRKVKAIHTARASSVSKAKADMKTAKPDKPIAPARKSGTIKRDTDKRTVNKKKYIANKNQEKLAKSARKKGVVKKPPLKKERPDAVPSLSDSDLAGYSILDHVVYPSHGVGQIVGIEEHEVGDQILTVFMVVFDKEKMTLRVPLGKVKSSGMRQLSSQQTMDRAIATLKGRARTRRVMWSRRAQEYDAKLNSGDPISIAEVVRDLHRSETQPDQSYSERQMYEAALERLAREYAAMENTNTEKATEELERVLQAA